MDIDIHTISMLKLKIQRCTRICSKIVATSPLTATLWALSPNKEAAKTKSRGGKKPVQYHHKNLSISSTNTLRVQ
jgi:hypothetical protein